MVRVKTANTSDFLPSSQRKLGSIVILTPKSKWIPTFAGMTNQSIPMRNSVNQKPNALSWLLLSTAIIALDQWTKYIVLTTLTLHQPVAFIAGFWNWMLAYNEGAAFSFLSAGSGWQRWMFVVLAIGVSATMAWWLARTPRGDWRTALPFALVVGGALGNVIDRIRLGHVVDFIQWYWGDHYWPTFNVADSAIVAGAIALLLFGFRNKPRAAVS